MRQDMAKKIVKHLERCGKYKSYRWKAEVKDGLVVVTEGEKKKEMTWDTFEHFFLRNK